MKYLIITVYGVQSSWGATSRGPATRPTDQLPTHSALVGMAGAASGKRQASEGINTFHRDLRTAVKVEKNGKREQDFQTVHIFDIQNVSTKSLVKRTLDRKTLLEELGKQGKVETKLTTRYYLTDAVYTVAYSSQNSEVDLHELKARFEKPIFPVYLGRKQFLPASDFMPEIIEANSFEEALLSRNSFQVISDQLPNNIREDKAFKNWREDLKENRKVLIAIPESSGHKNEWSVVRNDHCFNPGLRAFSGRKEYRTYVEIKGEH